MLRIEWCAVREKLHLLPISAVTGPPQNAAVPFDGDRPKVLAHGHIPHPESRQALDGLGGLAVVVPRRQPSAIAARRNLPGETAFN